LSALGGGCVWEAEIQTQTLPTDVFSEQCL
jgi:hypothetical protein